MKTVSQCLQESDIEALLTGKVDTSQSQRWEEHISSCDACRTAMAGQVGDQRWWVEAEQSLQSEPVAAGRKSSSDECCDECCDESCDAPDGLRHSANDSVDDRESIDELLKLLGPTDDPQMLGRIGTYEVLGVLGRGGMGIVFKAFDAPLNRYVAIKMLLPHLAASGAARKRFQREGQAAAAVIDDHVLPIYAVSEWQNIPYLVMQYSSGKNLQRRIDDEGPLDVKEILRIGMQAARGLAAAHAQGLVHRDVKPSNMLLDGSVERVMLTDFGLARAVDDASITRTGTIAGTPQYMSPEQARAKSVDARSDLFSLGCVLYAMSAGRPPFRAENSYAILRLITDEEPRPLQEINPDIPDWLCAIISKLMSKQAEDRYASADEVAELLEDCLAHVQQPATTPLPQPVAELVKSFGPRATTAPTKSHGGFRYPPIGRFIAAAAFGFSLIFAGVLIVLELNKGTLTIECDADNVPIRIVQGDKVVQRMTVSRSGETTRIAAGDYVVEVDGGFKAMTVTGAQVTLGRREQVSVRVTQSLAATQPNADRRPAMPDPFGGNVNPHAPNRVGPAQLKHDPFGAPANRYAPKASAGGNQAYATPVIPPKPVGAPDMVRTIEKPLGLTAMAQQFNRNMAAAGGDDSQPSLSAEELRCFALWKLDTDKSLSAEARVLFNNMGVGRWLNPKWRLDGGKRTIIANDGEVASYDIDLVNRHSNTRINVRRRYLSPPDSLQKPVASDDDETSMPLQAAITEFNAIHNEVGGMRQPPLELYEVLAALAAETRQRNDVPVDNKTFANFQRILKTHELPADSKLEVISRFELTEGDTFRIWSVRVKMPQVAKPGWTHAIEIRKQYISVESDTGETIHWGKPNDGGLQAGFRLVPGQRRYQTSQIDTEFFYRSISGKPIPVDLPNVFSHRKLIARDAAGNDLPVVEVKERTIGGAVTTTIGEQPTRKRGLPLDLGYITPDRQWDRIEEESPRTYVTVVDGHRCFLTYIVSDLDGGELRTGEVVFDIVSHRAVNAPALLAKLRGTWLMDVGTDNSHDRLQPNVAGNFGDPFQHVLTFSGGAIGQWKRSEATLPVSFTYYIEGEQIVIQFNHAPQRAFDDRKKQLRFNYQLSGNSLSLTPAWGGSTAHWTRAEPAKAKVKAPSSESADADLDARKRTLTIESNSNGDVPIVSETLSGEDLEKVIQAQLKANMLDVTPKVSQQKAVSETSLKALHGRWRVNTCISGGIPTIAGGRYVDPDDELAFLSETIPHEELLAGPWILEIENNNLSLRHGPTNFPFESLDIAGETDNSFSVAIPKAVLDSPLAAFTPDLKDIKLGGRYKIEGDKLTLCMSERKSATDRIKLAPTADRYFECVREKPLSDTSASTSLPSNATKLVGTWRPHPSTEKTWHSADVRQAHEELEYRQDNPHSDKWTLSFNADGTARFTGREHYLGVGPESPPATVDTWLTREFDFQGKWDIRDGSLTIVTDAPSVKQWKLIALTDTQLVLRHDTGIEKVVDGKQVPTMVDVVWVKQTKSKGSKNR